jgi:hypothetical protein
MVYVLCWAAYLPVIPTTGIEKLTKRPGLTTVNHRGLPSRSIAKFFERVIVDTGCEIFVVGQTAKEKLKVDQVQFVRML